MTKIDTYLASAGAGWQAGVAWVEGLKVGDKFLGCRPAAELAFPHDKLAQDVFISAAYQLLRDCKITCNADNVLVLPLKD